VVQEVITGQLDKDPDLARHEGIWSPTSKQFTQFWPVLNIFLLCPMPEAARD